MQYHKASPCCPEYLSPSLVQALLTIVQSWASRKFAVGCAILFPVVVTLYITYWWVAWIVWVEKSSKNSKIYLDMGLRHCLKFKS